MNEIEDSNGTMIPVSQVKRAYGVFGKWRATRLYDDDREGPCHLRFETVDGKEHWSKDYPDHSSAHAEMALLAARVKDKGQ
jgi:hypothetical protein